MESVAKRLTKQAGLDLEKLRSLEPDDLVKMLLLGLSDAISQVIPRQIGLPEDVRRALLAYWEDPEFQKDLREKIQIALAMVLRQEMPAPLADPIAAYLTDKILYPSLKALGDQLLRRIFRTDPSAPSFLSPRNARKSATPERSRGKADLHVRPRRRARSRG